MASTIDVTKPASGAATTQSVRDNFQSAKDEIEALQTEKADLSGAIFTGAVVVPIGDLTIGAVALTATGVELNYVDGVTSSIQTQLNAKLEAGDNVSDLVNDAGYLTSVGTVSFASLTGKPTTISGYGITDGVTLTGTETLTNKTLTAATINAGVVEQIDTLPTGGIIPLTDADGGLVFYNGAATTTFTDSLSNGESLTLMLRLSGGTITWPTVKWLNNGNAAPTVVPTLYTGVVLWKMGSVLYGAVIGTQA